LQPFATNWVFDTTPYNYLRFALKPTVANQTAQVYFMLVGDKPVVRASIRSIRPGAGGGAVERVHHPIGRHRVAKTKIYKFAIQDQTGLASNVFYVDDVAFVADAGRP